MFNAEWRVLQMLSPIKVVDIELSQPLQTLEGLDDYMKLQGLVRLHGTPIGYIHAPIAAGRCEAATISKLILEQHSWKIIHQLLQNGLAAPERADALRLEDLFDVLPPSCSEPLPLVTVAVCTRDRTADLALCLDALNQLDYPYLDLLVIDNAPSTDATQQLVQGKYPHVRYVCEPRPGLDWARNRVIIEAKGDIIAYTDDDVVVDAGWVKALATVFAENPEVMAVTGLVVPYELETEAQVLFEMYGGFGRGFEQKWYFKVTDKTPWQWLGAGQFGTGANMAFRRAVFEVIGYFDPALDVGTVTNGGGDLEMYYRVLKEGYTLVYEPNAIIRHRHRREYATLRRQISYNGVGLYAFLTGVALAYPKEILNVLYIGSRWLWWWHSRRIILSWIHPTRFPRDLILAEFFSFFQHFGRYQQACRNLEKISAEHPLEPQVPLISRTKRPIIPVKERKSTAIRVIDLSQPLVRLTDVENYLGIRLFATWKNQLLGEANIQNAYQNISVSKLRSVLASKFSWNLLKQIHTLSDEQVYARMNEVIVQQLMPSGKLKKAALPLTASIQVSVVVATYDRPDDLRNCLQHLVAQRSSRSIEIIVIDNHAVSGLTAPVVAEFPSVTLAREDKQGLSYARNAGILISHGEIIVTTDDDVTTPPDWLETLIAHFNRQDVMVITGNVLPIELETDSQKLFETYGGLGRGYKQFEVNGEWFEACSHRTVPTWNLGATANAAFRASIFRHPQIGLIDETLGAGTATGCSEDTYVFYKVLKTGYTVLYEPNAFVWHKHRRDTSALRHQIYNYSKGHVAYHLTTLLNDRDFRVLARLLVGLPQIHLSQIYHRLRGWTTYPISLVLVEILGNLAGPWALWRSRQRVKRLGHSTPGQVMWSGEEVDAHQSSLEVYPSLSLSSKAKALSLSSKAQVLPFIAEE